MLDMNVKDLDVQVPAEGILKRYAWGNTKVYQVVCDCGDSDHDHTVEVEADDVGVSVNIYTTNFTPFYSKGRWRQIWELLTKGYVKREVSISMTEQQAYNYANILVSSINDVKMFRAEYQAKRDKK
jgi:hypothetical protein